MIGAVAVLVIAGGVLAAMVWLVPFSAPASSGYTPVVAPVSAKPVTSGSKTPTAPSVASIGAVATQAAPAAVTQRVNADALSASVPAQLRIPAIGVDADPITRLGMTASGALDVPTNARTAGWFGGGPTPGQRGPSVIAGHVNYNGVDGVFSRLGALHAGDTATVRRGDDVSAVFTVYRVDRYPKSRFPTDSVYGNTSGPELRLITCGGGFDAAHRSYLDNIVVYARMTSAFTG
jgi:sortase (surface protein transpeptidase)